MTFFKYFDKNGNTMFIIIYICKFKTLIFTYISVCYGVCCSVILAAIQSWL